MFKFESLQLRAANNTEKQTVPQETDMLLRVPLILPRRTLILLRREDSLLGGGGLQFVCLFEFKTLPNNFFLWYVFYMMYTILRNSFQTQEHTKH